MAGSTDAETSLVMRVRGGDAGALRDLYTQHAAAVFGAAARMVDAAVAEDIVQEVFLALWKAPTAFDPERGELRSWLVTAAKNRARNELRRTKSRVAETDEPIDDSAAPDEAHWAEHRKAVVRRALEALPEAERRALSLAFMEDLTQAEVAAVLGTPLGTTKTRIRSALKRLAPMLIAAAVAGAVVMLWRRSQTDERALEMVTSSDVVPRRLEAVAGIPPEAHAQYRARPGVGTAVLTTTKLPPLGAGDHYAAWSRQGDEWTNLGEIEAGEEAHAMRIAESPSLKDAPAELRLTREHEHTKTPTGPTILIWVAGPRER